MTKPVSGPSAPSRAARLGMFAALMVALLVGLGPAFGQTQPSPGSNAASTAAGDVAWAKETLQVLGFNAGPVNPTITDLFRRRLREFQQSRNLPPTGELDQATIARLIADRPARQGVNALTVGPGITTGPARPTPQSAPTIQAAPPTSVTVEQQVSVPLTVVTRPGAATGPQPQVPTQAGSQAAPATARPQGQAQSTQSPAQGATATPAIPSGASGPRPAPSRTQIAAPQAPVEIIVPSDPPPPAAADRPDVAVEAPGPDVVLREDSFVPPVWVGWLGVAAFVGVLGAYVLMWIDSGQRGRIRGLAPAHTERPRRAPSFGDEIQTEVRQPGPVTQTAMNQTSLGAGFRVGSGPAPQTP